MQKHGTSSYLLLVHCNSKNLCYNVDNLGTGENMKHLLQLSSISEEIVVEVINIGDSTLFSIINVNAKVMKEKGIKDCISSPKQYRRDDYSFIPF